jgi:GNAT superfamily N-acetyltransferase
MPPDSSSSLDEYSVDAELNDGATTTIRAVRPNDERRWADFFARLSAASVYYRFFNSRKRPTAAELKQFVRPDFVSHVGLIAAVREPGGDETIIGDGRYIVQCEKSDVAEVALLIADGYQHRGVGTALLGHLARVAHLRGVARFEADVLSENQRAINFVVSRGFTLKSSGVDTIRFSISIPRACRFAALVPSTLR